MCVYIYIYIYFLYLSLYFILWSIFTIFKIVMIIINITIIIWNMRVTIIPIVTGMFGTVTKGLLKGLEDLEVGGRVKTIQSTALLRMDRTLRRVLET